MPDMRTTKQILNYIAATSAHCTVEGNTRIQQAIIELHRRGDTIVRTKDLRAILDELPWMLRVCDEESQEPPSAFNTSRHRLENALR